MTHTGSQNQVVFGLGSVEITYISTRKVTSKGVAIHASKAYAFSHSIPYLDIVQTQLPFEADKDIETHLLPFANKDLSSNITDSDSDDE